ncbi:MAG: dipicolinate synthase subunit B [Oscillospiraceae bacterium]|nr:dipicolinate synthase subunit B [Oscillospiraceae bacterium]
MSDKLKIGFALCGSFCTFKDVIEQMENLINLEYDVTPIMSFNAYSLDTRFGKASEIVDKIEGICGKKIINSIVDAEPIGPKKMFDALLVAPCTGNTLAKLANSIVDTPVCMAVKSHLRNNRPVVIAVSTNDALSGCAKNIGVLMNLRNYYFVPFRQDNCMQKPTSLVARFDKIPQTIEYALKQTQLQPMVEIV